MKSFSELFINKIVEYTFVTYEYEQTIYHQVMTSRFQFKTLSLKSQLSLGPSMMEQSGTFRLFMAGFLDFVFFQKEKLIKDLGTHRGEVLEVSGSSIITLFKTENEWQKTKPVPIPLPRASRNFPYVKF